MSADELHERATVTVKVPRERLEAVVKVFRWLRARAQTQPGLVSCSLGQDLLGRGCLSFCTEWRGREHLERFLLTEDFSTALAMAELGHDPPEVRFESLADRRGIDYVRAVRAARRTINDNDPKGAGE